VIRMRHKLLFIPMFALSSCNNAERNISEIFYQSADGRQMLIIRGNMAAGGSPPYRQPLVWGQLAVVHTNEATCLWLGGIALAGIPSQIQEGRTAVCGRYRFKIEECYVSTADFECERSRVVRSVRDNELPIVSFQDFVYSQCHGIISFRNFDDTEIDRRFVFGSTLELRSHVGLLINEQNRCETERQFLDLVPDPKLS
jgi:hypothetical protein